MMLFTILCVLNLVLAVVMCSLCMRLSKYGTYLAAAFLTNTVLLLIVYLFDKLRMLF